MRRKVLSWLLTISIIAGSFMPSSQAFAAEDAQEPAVIESSQDGVDDVASENLSDEENSEDTDNDQSEDPVVDPDSTVDAEFDETTEDVPDLGRETEEQSIEDTVETEVSEETTEAAESEIAELVTETLSDELNLTLRSVDLMYGESADNTDGHLDRLFAPAVADEDVVYELKTGKSSTDALTFSVSYKFIADKSVFDIDSEEFAGLYDTDRAEVFNELESLDLAKADAGSKLYVAAMAVTSDNKAAFALSEVAVTKRFVTIEFPATDELYVSKENYPEDGIIVVPAGSDLLSDVSVTVSDEYTVIKNDEEITVEGTDADILSAPTVSEFIAGDITVDVSDIDLLSAGYQPAGVTYELSEDLLSNYDVIAANTWPVLVIANEPVAEVKEETLVGEAKGSEDPDIKKNEIGFINHLNTFTSEVPDDMLTGVTIRSKRYGIKVDIYASRNANKSDAVLVGTKDNLENSYSYWAGNYYITAENRYYTANAVNIDFSELSAGKWYFFGRFYTGEGSKGYVDSNNIVLYNDETLPPYVPELVSVTDATGTDKTDGEAAFKKTAGKDTISYVPYAGGGSSSAAEKDGDSIGIYGLKPGKYAAYFTKNGTWFSNELYMADSQPVEFCVGVNNKIIPTGFTLYNATTGQDISDHVYIRKGDTNTLVAKTFTPATATERELVYLSSAPKVISVDAQGRCKALTYPGEAVITVSTKAVDEDGKPLVTKNVNVIANSALKIKSAKFEEGNVTLDYKGSSIEKNLKILLDEDVFCSVKWTVNNTSVADFEDNYATDAEDGEASKSITIIGPGKAVVTANLEGVKTVSCTITVNGTKGSGEPYYYNGNALSGFWGFKADGTPVASGIGSLKKKDVAFVRYYDPVTLKPVSNRVITAGKKLYLINDAYKLVVGASKKEARHIGDDYYVINTSGELQTGWQVADDEIDEYYHSPLDGKLVKRSWVPRGKGYTWVNKDGLMKDDGEAVSSLMEDGNHRIITGYEDEDETQPIYNFYCFKGGIRQSGLFYFADKKITTAKKAKYAAYYDPAAAGALAIDQIIWINGKKYYSNGGDIELNKIFIIKGGTKPYYADGTGAIQVSKFITYAGDDTYPAGTYYAKEDGELFKSGPLTIDGRIYYFDNYRLTGTDEGIPTHYWYLDADANLNMTYTKLANAKDPGAGSFFYSDVECKKKVTNVFLCYGSTIGDASTVVSAVPSLYLDKNGKLASGIVKVVMNAEGETTTFFFDPENGCKRYTGTQDDIIRYKGKYYACSKNGVINTATDRFTKVESYWVRPKNATGELMTGLQKIGGKKYFFSTKGTLCKPNDRIITSGDFSDFKMYFANEGTIAADPNTDDSWSVYAPGRALIYNGHVVNKDGSIVMKGWATVNGRKYYIFLGNIAASSDDNFDITRINGKYYGFNEDGSLYTGWKKVTDPHFIDINNFTSERYNGTFYFYFGKSGTLETGWKTMNTLKVDALGNVLDTNVHDGVTGPKKKIYFRTVSEGEYPIGSLAQNADITIGKKIYRFSSDGSVQTGKAGLVFSNPSMEAGFNGLMAYKNSDGSMARGRTLVKTAKGDYYFYFGLKDGVKEVNVFRKTGNKWYYYGDDGAMSTSVSVNSTLGTAFAVFNTDGSLKCFELKSGYGTVVTNTDVYLKNDDYSTRYVIGKNGLPGTGLQRDNTGRGLYYEADGSNDGFYDMNNTQLRKIGSRYYMFADGLLLNNNLAKGIGTGKVRIDDYTGDTLVDVVDGMFSLLPAADQKEAERCISLNEAWKIADHLTVRLNPDGSVREGEIATPYGSGCTNRLGINKDAVSLFYKQGSWRMS
nr:hypothetical protein [Butyrivibrio sp.]